MMILKEKKTKAESLTINKIRLNFFINTMNMVYGLKKICFFFSHEIGFTSANF